MRPFLLAALFSVFAAPMAPVAAETPFPSTICHKTAQMADRLQSRQGAARAARGAQSPDQILEVWTDDRGGWTLVVTYATGTSCIVAMGSDWESLPVKNPA